MSARWLLLFPGLCAWSCNGPDLNLGDSDRGQAGASNIQSQTVNGGTSGVTSNGGSTNSSAGTSASAGSSNAIGGYNSAGSAGSVNTLPVPRVEVIPFTATSALQSVYVGTDGSIWVGDNSIHTYKDGKWNEYLESIGEEVGDLWGQAARPIYAAGRQRVFAFGATWSVIDTLDCYAPLRIAVTPSYVYTACNYYTAGVHRVSRYAGAKGEPAPARTFQSSAIWAFSDSEVVALTGGVDSQGSPGLLAVFTTGLWNTDASWKDQEVPRTKARYQPLKDFWSSDGQSLLIVGGGGTIVRGKGNSWAEESAPSTAYLNAVWGSPSDGDYAVGDDGTILFFDRATWHALESPTSAQLTAIHGQPNGTIVAVGESGTVLRIVR